MQKSVPSVPSVPRVPNNRKHPSGPSDPSRRHWMSWLTSSAIVGGPAWMPLVWSLVVAAGDATDGQPWSHRGVCRVRAGVLRLSTCWLPCLGPDRWRRRGFPNGCGNAGVVLLSMPLRAARSCLTTCWARGIVRPQRRPSEDTQPANHPQEGRIALNCGAQPVTAVPPSRQFLGNY